MDQISKLIQRQMKQQILILAFFLVTLMGFAQTSETKVEDNLIYDEINKLEKTEVEEFTYTTFEEHFRIFILLGMALLLVEWILRITIYKSIV